MNQATGLRSAATASHPSRIASSGIAPPPAKGSRTRGARPPNAFRIASRRFPIAAAPSSSLSRPQCRIPPRVSSFMRSPLALGTSTIFPAIRPSTERRSTVVPGSGSNVASKAARLAASGRRAGQMCRVETCPCRTFFSCTESRDTCRSGNAASISRRTFTFLSYLPKMVYLHQMDLHRYELVGSFLCAARTTTHACQSNSSPCLRAQ